MNEIYVSAALALGLLAASSIGAQITAPLGERMLVPRPPALHWLGDVNACSGPSCAQAVAAEIALPAMSRVQLMGGGTAAHVLDSRAGDWLAERRVDLRYRNDRMSAWIGAVRSDRRTGAPASNGAALSRFESGLRFSWTHVDVALSVGTGQRSGRTSPQSETISVSDSGRIIPDTASSDGSASNPRAVSLTEVRASWSVGHVVLSSILGRASSPQAPPAVWGGLEAARSIGRRALVFVNAGTTPAPMLLGTAGGTRRNVNVGVRLSELPFASGRRSAEPEAATPAFVVQRAGQGQYRLRIRVANAHRVELGSDCTGWQPLVMMRIDDDLWESVLPATAGPHFVSIRIDGGVWIAPPGLVPKSDDFAGSVGVFVIE